LAGDAMTTPDLAALRALVEAMSRKRVAITALLAHYAQCSDCRTNRLAARCYAVTAHEEIQRAEADSMAALPAATGKDRTPPEPLTGLDAYDRQLLAAYEMLPLERRHLLQFPVLAWHEFCELALHFYNAIDARTDHDLEGWLQLGHLAHEYRLALDAPWRQCNELLAMSPEQRAAIHALLGARPEFTRIRKLSPREVWTAHKHELTKVSDALLPTLLGPPHARELTVTNDGYLTLEDHELSPEPLLYLATPISPISPISPILPRGRVVLAYPNPFDLSRLVVCEAAKTHRGAYLGACPAWIRTPVQDTAALAKKCGQVAKLEAAILLCTTTKAAFITQAVFEGGRGANNAAVAR